MPSRWPSAVIRSSLIKLGVLVLLLVVTNPDLCRTLGAIGEIGFVLRLFGIRQEVDLPRGLGAL